MNLNNGQFFKLGGPRQQRKKFGGSEGTWNPVDAFKSVINSGPTYRLKLQNKAKEDIIFGALSNTIDVNRQQMKHKAGEDAYFNFNKRHAEEMPGVPVPQEFNLSGGVFKQAPTAAIDLERFRAENADKDAKMKKMADELKTYKDKYDTNEDREPDAPTPGSK